ncbi:hypothetical protein Y032_0007g3315 [Ancylostoma ceylanicum]|nr:hypothetical protein Y032_0007g3315 [Ancylostoma ceylanicum]
MISQIHRLQSYAIYIFQILPYCNLSLNSSVDLYRMLRFVVLCALVAIACSQRNPQNNLDCGFSFTTICHH